MNEVDEIDLRASDMEAIMKLSEFKLWARQHGDRLGYAVASWIPRQGGRTPNISYDEAIALDSSLGAIKQNQSRDFKILWKAYILGMEDQNIGEQMFLSANRVNVLRGAALKAWYFHWLASVRE